MAEPDPLPSIRWTEKSSPQHIQETHMTRFTLFIARSAGKPMALSQWCQNGYCVIQTIERTTPILVDKHGTLFRADIQNWNFHPEAPKNKVPNNSVSYVICSKKFPAVIEEIGQNEFIVDFITPNDDQTYHHSNSALSARLV